MSWHLTANETPIIAAAVGAVAGIGSGWLGAWLTRRSQRDTLKAQLADAKAERLFDKRYNVYADVLQRLRHYTKYMSDPGHWSDEVIEHTQAALDALLAVDANMLAITDDTRSDIWFDFTERAKTLLGHINH